MPSPKKMSLEGIERKPLKAFTEMAYLDYSMYVILDRALPHIADGLKPVQRRIIYAMSELNLSNDAKYKKSARTVGDVLGKFHPHGETACYEAMVLMSQQFSYRYPLVDGQGNWGSQDDPKSFAAMRYTEARLSRYAEILLNELEQGTVNWVPNFDGSLEEPKLLPARLPNVLLNGTTGIAVGMATDIPPHNMREVVNACVHLLENPKATLETICSFIQGPDFPTEAEIITPKAEIQKIYQTGVGSLRARAIYSLEEGEVVVTALPFSVSGAKVLTQIAELMQAKKLLEVSDLRDESDHENPTRLVITPRSNRVDIEALMAYLFSATDLERSYRVNLNMIGLDGRPKVKDLKSLLTEWLEFRTQTVRLRLEHRLQKVLARLHILEGLLIAYLNLDEVIHIIRTAEDPKQQLMKKFKLSEEQVTAILDLKLRNLAKLEENKIKAEQKDLSEEREYLEKTLGSEQKLKTLIKKELIEDAKNYGDARRSPLVEKQEAVVTPLKHERIVSEPVTVILSAKGWVRAGKGHEKIDGASLSYKTGDEFKLALPGKTDQPIIFFDSTGRSYSLLADVLPSARGYGEPLTSHFTPPPGANFEWMLTGEPNSRFLLLSSGGYGFKVPFEELVVKNRKGKAMVKVPEGRKFLLGLKLPEVETKARVACFSDTGHLLIFPLKDVIDLTKGKGQKLMSIKKEEALVNAKILLPQSTLKIKAKRELVLGPNELEHYYGEIATRGRKLPSAYRENVAITTIDNK